MVNVVGRIIAPTGMSPILISRTHESVTLHGNRNFADVIKDSETQESYPGLSEGVQNHHKRPYK